MKLLKISACALITALLSACDRKEAALVKDLYRIYPAHQKEQIFVVIPNGGCEGCITFAESFVKSGSRKYPDLAFVFTRISSVKKLRLIMGDSVINNKNVVLDTLNIFKDPDEVNRIYPLVVYTNDGKLTKLQYQSPESAGIADLKTLYEGRN